MQSPEFAAFRACLPERIGNSSYSAEHLALIVLCGFWYQSLRANHVYGHMALVAHNFLRAMAILMRSDKPHFVKKLRGLMIHFPGRLVKDSRYFRMKIPHKFYQEVMAWIERWLETCKPARDSSTA